MHHFLLNNGHLSILIFFILHSVLKQVLLCIFTAIARLYGLCIEKTPDFVEFKLGVFKRTISMRRFFLASKTNLLADVLENIHNFTCIFCLSKLIYIYYNS